MRAGGKFFAEDFSGKMFAQVGVCTAGLGGAGLRIPGAAVGGLLFGRPFLPGIVSG